MPEMFEKAAIRGMTLRNRLVRSATWEGLAAEDGSVTDTLVDMLRDVARGGAGLVIPGFALIGLDGKGLPRGTGVFDDAQVPGLKRIADALAAEGARSCLQLVHCGARSDPDAIAGGAIHGPSAVPAREGGSVPVELDAGRIARIVWSFAEAARRAAQAGFDAVQIHAAHGFLVSQFLSPYFNRRTDAYGGSPKKRSRFALEVLGAVREAVGPDFPVLAKLNGEDFSVPGMTAWEAEQTAVLLEKAGLDAVEVSGGIPAAGGLGASRTGIRAGADEAYFAPQARRIREAVGIPVILTGGLRSLPAIERVLGEGACDLVGLSRPLIREPDLVERWRSGDREPARCISCNRCAQAGREGRGVHCVVEEEERVNQGI